MAKKNQSKRLTSQHKESQGVVGIFGENAKTIHYKKIVRHQRSFRMGMPLLLTKL